MSDFDYAVNIDLVKTASASCEECAPREEPKHAGLPEGFGPARATFKKLGLR